jgi:peroxiredoxin
VALCEGAYLEPTETFDEQLKRLRLLGRAQIGLGHRAAGESVLAELQKMLADTKSQQDKAGQDAAAKALAAKDVAPKKAEKSPETSKDGKMPPEKEREKLADKARTDARRTFDGKITQLTTAVDELTGRLAMCDGRHADGLKLLEKNNGVLKEHLAQYLLQAGQTDRAVQVALQARTSGKNEVYPLANYVDVLYRAGRKDDARKALGDLLGMSSAIDLDTPLMQRLAPAAKEFGYAADWRRPRETPGDIGQRPPLASLGPFRWRPAPAEDWSLPSTTSGGTLSLREYRGKPVIVIFYLGYGCLHCAQQIEKFATKVGDFRKAGIDMLAISSDATSDLRKSVERFEAEKQPRRQFPMPLAADPELRVFRQYRAYDDFERIPLHGTFLVDSQGLVRWQDIGFEPFMDADFLLAECQRLLKQPAGRE